jgi:hypothetical protein
MNEMTHQSFLGSVCELLHSNNYDEVAMTIDMYLLSPNLITIFLFF